MERQQESGTLRARVSNVYSVYIYITILTDHSYSGRQTIVVGMFTYIAPKRLVQHNSTKRHFTQSIPFGQAQATLPCSAERSTH